MLLTFAGLELKNIIKEKITSVMLIWPLLFGIAVKILIEKEILTGVFVFYGAASMIVMTGFIYGAMAGFSILDDRDDDVIKSISISPVPVKFYIWFKIGFAYVFSVVATIIMFLLIGVFDFTPLQLITVSLLCSMNVPINAMIVNAIATNKVEGFVSMKATGFLILCPMIAWFFTDWKEWLFFIGPSTMPMKAMQYLVLKDQISAGAVTMNLDFNGYMLLGAGWCILLSVLTYKLFCKKNDI